MKLKIKRILAGIAAFTLIFLLLFVANSLVGNPISKKIAKDNAVKYLEKTYPNMDLKIDSIGYEFKFGRYYAKIKSETSIDTHFSLDISCTGEILFDTYTANVLEKGNTCQRINEEYEKMTDKIFDSPDFPYNSNVAIGTIQPIGDDSKSKYGIDTDKLELDKTYDIHEIAASSGHIIMYVEDEDVSIKNACDILLEIKNIFDKEKVPFFVIDFTLQKPHNPDRTKNDENEHISVENFFYSDIYEENFEQRLSNAADELKVYYEQEDAKKFAEDNIIEE